MAEWVFQQLEGPASSRRRMTLSAYNAPFGRPRKEAIFKELIRSRVQITRYPGASKKQTRHAFGVNWEPFELKGRWMTRHSTASALDISREWIRFIKDERTCRIAWGNIISWTGYIEELELAHESEDDIAWRMKIIIDSRDDDNSVFVRRHAPKVSDDVAFLQSWVATANAQKDVAVDNLTPDFLESLENLAGELNKPAALLAKLAGDFDDLEKRTYSLVQHFRGAVANMQTAIATMRLTVLHAEVDSMNFVRTAESDINWLLFQLDFDYQSTVMLDVCGRLDRTAQLAESPEASKFVVARQGDTWESLSTRATGGPQKAAAIRSLNGGRYGTHPTPGEMYLVQ
jgi:hypothetical protein